MPNERVIPTAASPDVCTFTIFSDGNEVSRTYHVMSISVSHELNRIPTASIILLDGEAARETFEISDTNEFIPGKEIKIQVGYRGEEDTIFEGIVIRHSIKVRKNSAYLILDCKDKAVKMTAGLKNKYFSEQKDSDIIEELIGQYGLDADVAATTVEHLQMVQYRATDWDFMLHRATANGMFIAIENGKVSIQKPDLGQEAAVTLQYGSSLLELDAEMDARAEYAAVKTAAWNYTDQELATAEGQDPNLELNGNISPDDLAQVIGLDAYQLWQSGKLTEPELQNWADAVLLQSQLAKILGRAKCQGNPAIKPGSIVELNGIGDRFNGKAFVSGVRHQIAKGNWEMDLQIGYNPNDWTPITPSESANLSKQLLPTIQGLHVGIVTQLQDDPEGENRIKVKLPVINTADEGIWTRIATLDAGENRGTFFLPEIGDEVIVGFLDNDPRQAVMLGMCHSSAKPAPLEASDDNHEKGYVSRSEMKMIFDDDKKTLLLETPGGNKVLLTDEDQGIMLEDGNGNKITMDSSGIVIESATELTLKAAQSLTVEGLSVDVKAQTGFKADGGGGCELSAGSGSTVVKGGIVRIN